MTRFKTTVLALGACLTLMFAIGALPATAAPGEFSIEPGSFSSETFAPETGDVYTQAGGHPGHFVTSFNFNSQPAPGGEPGIVPAGANLKLGEVDLPPGMVGNPTVIPECLPSEFFTGPFHTCSDDTQIGMGTFEVNLGGNLTAAAPIFNLEAGPGQPAAFGMWVVTVPVVLVPKIRSNGDYGLTVVSRNVDETLPITKVKLDFWGVPASSEHDGERGGGFWGGCNSLGATPPCVSHARQEAFLTTPVDCSSGPYVTPIRTESWAGEKSDGTYESKNQAGEPSGRTGCDKVPFSPAMSAQPSVGAAESPSGFKFELKVPDAGLRNPNGLGQAEIKKAEVELPEGMSLNPSSGEGLGACTPADFAREAIDTPPGIGCPNASKLGSVQIQSPLLEEKAEGSLYLAQTDDPTTTTPGAENPFDSLVALYMVVRIPDRGVFVKAAGKVTPDPVTGRIVTTFDDLPQLPISSFILNFREGARSPLVTPPACGEYAVKARLTPWSASDLDNPSAAEIDAIESPFQITSGVGNGPCPTGGAPSFKPGLLAGTISNAAGRYSPFNVRLTRNDGEQEFTRFSIKLPPGILGKLAGIPYCPDSAIEAARQRTATAELASPSCPAASEIGRTLVGAGVGSILTYVPGKVYLAGPYHGSSLSIAAITAAKVGPFDVGTVVIRQALKVDPDTAEVFIDSVGSDSIPHIIDGIKVHARDIRVYVDRPDFILNPTSCERTSTASTVLGSGLDFVSDADDTPVTVTSPFQAADCGALDFSPKLALSVSGATKRAGNPKFKAVLTMKPGQANIARAQVTLPKTEFLDNAHIGTVCTRIQFRAKECPAASIYGRARAVTPILDQPVEGPVYLRSNPEHSLPDLVAALAGQQIEVDLAGRVDSVGEGRIRNTFEAVPDAPVTKFVLEMAGGKKGLLENSADLCAKTPRATAKFVGQNGKKQQYFPALKVDCKKKGKRHK